MDGRTGRSIELWQTNYKQTDQCSSCSCSSSSNRSKRADKLVAAAIYVHVCCWSIKCRGYGCLVASNSSSTITAALACFKFEPRDNFSTGLLEYVHTYCRHAYKNIREKCISPVSFAPDSQPTRNNGSCRRQNRGIQQEKRIYRLLSPAMDWLGLNDRDTRWNNHLPLAWRSSEGHHQSEKRESIYCCLPAPLIEPG